MDAAVSINEQKKLFCFLTIFFINYKNLFIVETKQLVKIRMKQLLNKVN